MIHIVIFVGIPSLYLMVIMMAGEAEQIIHYLSHSPDIGLGGEMRFLDVDGWLKVRTISGEYVPISI